MRGSLSFDIDPSHFARQLDLAADRCTDYFRLAFPKHLDPHDAPRVFPATLRLTRAPDEHSMVLGIYAVRAREGPRRGGPPSVRAVGVRPGGAVAGRGGRGQQSARAAVLAGSPGLPGKSPPEGEPNHRELGRWIIDPEGAAPAWNGHGPASGHDENHRPG